MHWKEVESCYKAAFVHTVTPKTKKKYPGYDVNHYGYAS